MFYLLHARTLRRLTALQVRSGFNSEMMAYLGMRVKNITKVTCAPHQFGHGRSIYSPRAQYVEIGGSVYSKTTRVVTKTLFYTHISSVACRCEDTASMLPLPHVTGRALKTRSTKC